MRTACKQSISVSIRLLTTCLFVLFFSVSQSFAQNINTVDNFPDPQFKAAVEKFMFGPGVAFTAAQAAAKTGTLTDNGNGIIDITGLGNFSGLTGLNLAQNSIANIESATLAALPNLTTLNLSDNQLATLDLSGNVALQTIRLGTNQLTEVGGIGSLLTGTLFNVQDLDISNNSFTGIDTSGLLLLDSLNISNNSIAAIDLSNNTQLTSLNAAGNGLSSLDLTNNVELRELNLASNSFTSFAPTSNLVLPNDPMNFQLEVFNISGNALGNIAAADWARLTFLLSLDISNNSNLSTMNITPLTNLESLTATNLAQDPLTGFTSLNTGSNVNLTSVNLSDNAISRADLSSVSGVTFTNNTNLVSLNLSGNLIGDTTITFVTGVHDMLRSIDPGAPSANDTLQILDLSRNRIDGVTFANQSLRELNLSENTIQILSVTGYTALETLNVASNTTLFASKSLPFVGDDVGIPAQGGTELATFPLDLRAISGAGGTLTQLDITNTGALFFLTDGSNPYDDTELDNVLGYIGSMNQVLLYHGMSDLYNLHGHQAVVIPAQTSLTRIIAASNDIYSASGRINPTITAALPVDGGISNGSTAISFLYHADVVAGNLSLDLRRNDFQVADETNEMATISAYYDSTEINSVGELVEGFAYIPRADPSDQGGALFAEEATALANQGIVLLQPTGGEKYSSPQFGVPIYYAVAPVAGAANNNIRIEVSYDGGATYTDIVASVATTANSLGELSTATWNIPADQDTSQAVIRISRVDDPTVVDTSDYFFQTGRGSGLTAVFTGATLSFTAGLFVDPQANIPQVTVGVFADVPEGLTGYKLRISYDPSKFFFEAGSVDKSGTITSTFSDPVVNNDAQAGILRIISSGQTPVPVGTAASEIVRFTLNAFSDAASGSSNIALINSDTFFNDGAIDVRTSLGTVQVVNRFVWGDLSGDGIVGVLDAANILRWAVGLITSFPNFPNTVAPAFPAAADLNADGIVGTLDSSAVLAYAADPVANPIPADLDGDGLGPDPIVSKHTPAGGQTQLLASVNGAGVVKFSVANGSGIQGFRVALDFDSSSVSVEDVQSLVPGAQIFVNEQDGKLIVAGSMGRSLNPGSADLLSIAFNAGDNGLVSIDKSLTNLNDGFTAVSVGSVDVVDVNSSTDVPAWMLY